VSPSPAVEDEQTVTRTLDVDAPPEDVYEALATEDGRDRWLDDDSEREIHVERAAAPHHLVWWWWSGDGPATRVEFFVAAVPGGSRVVVTESSPRLPIAALALALTAVPA